MEIDGDLERVEIARTTGALLDGGDLEVQSFCDSVSDAMGKVGQHIRQMTGDKLGRGDHGLQAAVRRPEVPALPPLRRPRGGRIAPQIPRRLLERPRPAGLEFGDLQFLDARSGLVGHVRRVGQPQVLALGQRRVSSLRQRLVLLLPDPVQGIDNVPHDVELKDQFPDEA